jgi:hypothetical protein
VALTVIFFSAFCASADEDSSYRIRPLRLVMSAFVCVQMPEAELFHFSTIDLRGSNARKSVLLMLAPRPAANDTYTDAAGAGA